jgi:hypothetical protein
MITKETSMDGSGFGCGVGLPVNAKLIAENCIVYNNQKPDGTGTLTFSFGANKGTANNVISTVLNCAYDAINAGNGTQNGVVFATKTASIDDLSPDKMPGFVLPVDFYGPVSTAAPEYEQFASADYHLTSGSVCIDSGDNTAALGLSRDLANNDRIYNDIVDMGAYEYNTPTSLNTQIAAASWNCYSENGRLIISGLSNGSLVSIYDLSGRKICEAKGNKDLLQIPGISKGIYIVKSDDTVQKVVCK